MKLRSATQRKPELFRASLSAFKFQEWLSSLRKFGFLLKRFFYCVPLLQEYYLPNQPIHTSDLTGAEWQRRHIPHSPVHRTQSSPSLYSSNLVRSPPTSAQASPKAPRPPVAGNTRLPPRPPAGRKPTARRPLFSSGTSWRARK